MSLPPTLTPALLDELEQRWRTLGLPLLDRLRPGLTDAEIDTLVAPLGLDLPEEARTWWRWHDGIDLEGATGNGWTFGPDRRPFGPLAAAVGECERLRTMAGELADPSAGRDETYWWSPTWFPLTTGGKPLVCDCAVAGRVTPIRIYDTHVETFHKPRADSFGQVVTWWIEAYDNGEWQFVADQWIRNVDLVAERAVLPPGEHRRYDFV